MASIPVLPTLLVSLPEDGHAALFENLPGAESRLVRESATGLSAEELAVQIAIGLAGSATYDLLKLFPGALRDVLAKLLHDSAGDARHPTVVFGGIKYTIATQADLDRLLADLHEAFDDAFPGQSPPGA